MSVNRQKLLNDLEEAIDRVATTGQSGRVGDMEITEANLGAMRLYRKELLKEIARSTGKRPLARKITFL
jgi:hypothetical protein